MKRALYEKWLIFAKNDLLNCRNFFTIVCNMLTGVYQGCAEVMQ